MGWNVNLNSTVINILWGIPRIPSERRAIRCRLAPIISVPLSPLALFPWLTWRAFPQRGQFFPRVPMPQWAESCYFSSLQGEVALEKLEALLFALDRLKWRIKWNDVVCLRLASVCARACLDSFLELLRNVERCVSARRMEMLPPFFRNRGATPNAVRRRRTSCRLSLFPLVQHQAWGGQRKPCLCELTPLIASHQAHGLNKFIQGSAVHLKVTLLFAILNVK